jgi:hypothetical protein
MLRVLTSITFVYVPREDRITVARIVVMGDVAE